ncbi:MAG: peptide/nickel transport system ATP-binding protein ddpF, partial [Acidimicrobiaceae bacterium]
SVCVDNVPVLAESRGRLVSCHFGGLKTLLSAERVSKTFRAHGSEVRAVSDVSFTLNEGEAVGLIGPSGSGKSTLSKMLTGQLAPDSGRVMLEGAPLPTSWRKADKAIHRRIQLVMQDPFDALSPRLSVEALVREPLDLLGDDGRAERATKVMETIESVGLPTSRAFVTSHTHELSGGQLQRVALARALIVGPKLLVADEPTSMLDASEQARLLVVMRERQVEMGLGLVLVSHDMAVVRKVTDRIVVLDRGEVVEEGPSQRVSTAPESPTARRLIEAAPSMSLTESPEPETLIHKRGS